MKRIPGYHRQSNIVSKTLALFLFWQYNPSGLKRKRKNKSLFVTLKYPRACDLIDLSQEQFHVGV